MSPLLERLFGNKDRNPARELALHGIAQRRRLVIETARKMREELGMAPDPRLQ